MPGICLWSGSFSFNAYATTSTGRERWNRKERKELNHSCPSPVHPLLKLVLPLWDRLDLFMFTHRCSCRRRHLCEAPRRDGGRGGTGWQRQRARGERRKGWNDRWRSVWSGFDKGTELCGLSATSLVIIYVDFFFFKFAVCTLYEIDKKPRAPRCARLGCSS